MRILRDPAPAEGGGTATTTATPAADNPGSATPPPPPSPPPTVPLTVDEYNRLREVERRMATVEDEKRQQLEAKERERAKALADKGETEKALAAIEEQWKGKYSAKDQELSDLRREYYGEKTTVAIHDGIGAAKFVSDAARADAVAKIRGMLEPRADASGRVAVVCRTTGRPAEVVIREAVASKDFAHFLEPSTRGGGGATGGDRATSTASPAHAPDPNAEWTARFKAAIDRRAAGAPGLAGTYGGPVVSN